MSRRSSSIGEAPDGRHARLLPVIEDAIARRLKGEDLTDEAIISAHPELMPGLRELLGELQIVEAARRRAGRSSKGWALGSTGRIDEGESSAPSTYSLAGYEVRGEIHRGGQGVVYRAVQKFTQRDVAIKVMHEGPFSGPGERARFQREVKILAGLNHPNIVTIHESGIVNGRHYFVMDYIPGSALDTYVDGQWEHASKSGRIAPGETRTNIRTILQLFHSICQAVNSAHLRGIIHRDIKPSNIRVDDSGRPHVLDFGLAKLSDGLPDVTIAGQFIGSLPWCSPEQAEGRPDKVDMRSDVYSLGVVLYRILTRNLPYDVTGTSREVLDHIVREPPVDPRRHNPAIDEEVATITLKCLHKDPERRYQTAGQVASDVQRYLGGEAIEAKRDSGLYVLRKTLRRYRVQAGVAAAFIFVLTVSAIALGILYRKAQLEARKAEITTSFLRDTLAAADPNTSQGKEVTVREILDTAAGRVDEQLTQEPQVAVAMHSTIGQTYLSLGHAKEAERSYRAGFDLAVRALGVDHSDTLVAQNGLATAFEDQSRYDEAEALFRECLDTVRRVQGPDSSFAIDVLHNLANLLRKRSKHAEAKVLLEEALERSRRVLGEENESTLITRKILAAIRQEMGQVDEAEAEYRAILTIQRRVLGDRSPLTLGTMNYLARLLKARGKLDEAAPVYDELVRLTHEVLGPDHPDTLRNKNSYGRLLQAQGKLAEAEATLRETLDAMNRRLGPDHFDTIVTTNNLSVLLSEQGRVADAEPLARKAVEQGRALLGDENADTLSWLNNLGNLLFQKGNAAEAEELYRHVLEVRRRLLGDEHPQTLTTMSSLANLHVANGGPRQIEAEATLRHVLELRQRLLGPSHADTLLSMNNLVKALLARERFEEAEPLALQALSASRETFGPAHPLTFLITNTTGETLAHRGRIDDAISILSDAVTLAGDKLPHGHVYRTTLRATLGKALVEAGRLDEALVHLTVAMEDLTKTLGPQHPTTRNVAQQLARIHEARSGAAGVTTPREDGPSTP
ncbi:MAG: tetratricopeptide repeat protein [Planctomycetes bacterium]|nr:tetratricopeptide repeat protein [Planctomycetota bacterium]